MKGFVSNYDNMYSSSSRKNQSMGKESNENSYVASYGNEYNYSSHSLKRSKHIIKKKSNFLRVREG